MDYEVERLRERAALLVDRANALSEATARQRVRSNELIEKSIELRERLRRRGADADERQERGNRETR